MRTSRADRMRAELKDIKGELRKMMHLPIAEQGGSGYGNSSPVGSPIMLC